MLFDEWPEQYDQWFNTPIGQLVKRYESELVLDMLAPLPGEHILDVGCGTGIFTEDMFTTEAEIVGLDISLPMLQRAKRKLINRSFTAVIGDIVDLPFSDETFNKVCSITALEFVKDGGRAAAELNRVTRKNGTVVVATLNSLSPWAKKREERAQTEKTIFDHAIFRSPEDLVSIIPETPVIQTAIHFQQDDAPGKAAKIEREGCQQKRETGAFIAACWRKQ